MFYFLYKTLSPLRHYNIISELEFYLRSCMFLNLGSLESFQMLKAKPRTPWLSWDDQNLN